MRVSNTIFNLFCNLKCMYVGYSQKYLTLRNFTNTTMSIEMAQFHIKNLLEHYYQLSFQLEKQLLSKKLGKPSIQITLEVLMDPACCRVAVKAKAK